MKSKLYIDHMSNKYWKLPNGKYHKKNAPAIILNNGNEYWYKNGLLHREDGPAIECTNGVNFWYLNGIVYSEQEYKKKMRLMKLKHIL
mgnify:CR=1 FL=1